jgi:hypothetical protein
MLYLSASVGRTMICNALGLEEIMGRNARRRSSGLKFYSTLATLLLLAVQGRESRVNSPPPSIKLPSRKAAVQKGGGPAKPRMRRCDDRLDRIEDLI